MVRKTTLGMIVAGRAVAAAIALLALATGCFELDEDGIEIILESPADGSTSGLTVTFRWSIANPESGKTYQFFVLTDKGANPFDGAVEDMFDAGSNTELTVTLDAGRYNGQTFDWGVEARSSSGDTGTSSIWHLSIQ